MAILAMLAVSLLAFSPVFSVKDGVDGNGHKRPALGLRIGGGSAVSADSVAEQRLGPRFWQPK